MLLSPADCASAVRGFRLLALARQWRVLERAHLNAAHLERLQAGGYPPVIAFALLGRLVRALEDDQQKVPA